MFNALRGYNAAHVYDTPGNFIAALAPAGQSATKTAVTVVPDTRPQITLTAAEDLGEALGHLTGPTIVLLPTGATYDITKPITLATDGFTLRAAGAGPAPRIRRIAAAGIYSTLIVNASDITIEGIEFDSDQPLKSANNNKVGVYAINYMGKNLMVRKCTFRNVDDGLHCEPTAHGLLVLDCQYTNELRSCGVYTASMQSVVVLGITAVGSVCEHIFRLEGARNVLLHGSDVANQDGKETIAIRHADCVAITNNTIRTWCRISQGLQAQPGVYCRHILFAGNHFAGTKPGGPWIAVNPGCQTVLIEGNVFDVDETLGCIAVQAPSVDLKFTGNQQILMGGAKTCKPLVRPFGNPTFVESGTIMAADKSGQATNNTASKGGEATNNTKGHE